MNKIFKPSIISFLLAVCLIACTPSSTLSISATSTLPTEMIVPTPTITQTATLAFTPTPSIWEIQQCNKEPSILSEKQSLSLIWRYIGDIQKHGRVDMILSFNKNNEIRGFLFDFSKRREYRVIGCVKDRMITMWLQQGSTVDAIIQGEFAETDPRGYYSSSAKLSTSVITGLLREQSNTENLAMYLRTDMANGGTMEDRFKLEGVEDESIILNATQQFLAAIAKDDRNQVVEMIRFPVDCTIKKERKQFQTPESFLAYYNAIFGDGFKERLAITFPNYLIAYSGNVGGIGLSVYGGGAIFFNANGKVIAIYNEEEKTPTPTALPGGNP